MINRLKNIFSFINLMEQLKNECRHSWTSTGRQESVAEHSWRLAIMVMALEPHLEHPIKLDHAIKMALIHDCVEALAGDIPVFELTTTKDHQAKQQRETEAIEQIATILGDSVGQDIKALWYEFEQRQSAEAKLVYALDKLECKIQHNEAHIDTWNEQERGFTLDWQDELYDFDATILALRDLIKIDSIAKVEQADAAPIAQ
jgi:putative hydrolases of HD superfamily